MTDAPRDTIRIDKWLWHARFFKTRTLAASIVAAGKVRLDGTPVAKPARAVGAGDVLTFAKEGDIKVIRIVALGSRRGPASEAQMLYEDLSPPPAEKHPHNPRFDGTGRPGKRERRNMKSQLGDNGPFDLE